MGPEGAASPDDEGDMMSIKDKISHAAEEVAGKAKKSVGKATGDRDLEAQGATDEAVAKGKRIVDQVKDSAVHTVAKIKKIAK